MDRIIREWFKLRLSYYRLFFIDFLHKINIKWCGLFTFYTLHILNTNISQLLYVSIYIYVYRGREREKERETEREREREKQNCMIYYFEYIGM